MSDVIQIQIERSLLALMKHVEHDQETHRNRSGSGENEKLLRGYVKVYHGTAGNILNSIKKYGLDPEKGQEVWVHDETFYSGDRKGAVFVTKSLSRARGYASDAAALKSKRSLLKQVVIEMKIPREIFDREFKLDEREATSKRSKGKSFYRKGKIDPKYIVRIHE